MPYAVLSFWSIFTTGMCTSREFARCVCTVYTHLCNKLDDLDKNVEGHVSGHNAATPFGEQSGGDGRQTTGGGRGEETQAERVVRNLKTEVQYSNNII